MVSHAPATVHAATPAMPRVLIETAWLVAANDAAGLRLATAAPVPAGEADQLVTGRFLYEGNLPAEGLRIELAIPAGTRYVPDSATGPGAKVRFSADGGRTFGSPAELAPGPDDYTHIRWELPGTFAPGTAGLVSFRVRAPAAASSAATDPVVVRP